MSAPIHDFDASGHLVRGAGPRSVPVYREMVFGGELVHPLDFVVLTHALFAIAGGEEVTVQGLWKRLQELGIRSAKNAQELVGKNSVYESFNRIISAGFIRRIRLPHPDGGGRKGPVAYEVYEFASDNPDFQQPSDTPLPGTGDVDVAAVHTTSRNRGSGVPGSGVPGRGGRHVSAGQRRFPGSGKRAALPPHPPEEVNTSSPYPLGTRADGVAPAAREEEGEILSKPTASAEQVEAASQFLQVLPRPWTAGRVTARTLAPLLAEVVAEQGWELDDFLVRELTQNPEGVKRPTKVLKSRIEDLPRRLAACKDVPRPRPAVAEDPDFEPVPMPDKVASILTGLRRPAV
ncbi:hypothetical protein [Streptomyces sp. NBC_01207]|uniref:hypothetical protein n=1 Tax=Streptomyces sp. NBC_01207 TaxID=2903772 RepID=UPI002E0DE8D1|nr:hypothetical protein OG457_48385 [Streptomyces sp. NBC_01207]